MEKNKKSMRYSVMVFKFAGLWPPENKIGYIFYRIYNILYFGLFTWAVPINIIQRIIHGNGGPLEIMECLFLCIQEVCFAVKVSHLAYNHKKVKHVVDLLEQTNFTNHSLDQEDILEAARKVVVRNSLGVMLYYFSSGMAIGITPIFDAEHKKLPLTTWYPFDYTGPIIFPIMYIYEFIGVSVSALTNGCIDTFISGLMCHASGQLEVLQDSLKKLRKTALNSLKRNEDCDCVNQNICSKDAHLELPDTELEGAVYEEVVRSIEHYEAITQFVKEIETTFNWELFSQFTASMAVLCITAFELTLLSPFSMRFTSVASFAICIMIQNYLYCLYGNNIEFKSSLIGEAVYSSDWYRFSGKINRALRILMERAKRPLFITAGKLVKLSLDTYVSIGKSAYSFFTVIRQMDFGLDIEE